MGKRLVTDEQAHALAELYVWDTVVAILEGSTAPRTTAGQVAASRVVRTAQAQQRRLITVYDKQHRGDSRGGEGRP